MSQHYVGQRLSFSDALCTVRYVGEVDGTKGEWLGVEWDDPTRGKHGGEHGGRRYFDCLQSLPTAASFVRPSRKADPKRTFIEALKHKYASEILDEGLLYEGDSQPQQQQSIIRISGKEVEEVGFDKIRRRMANLKELRIVILDGLRISGATSSSKDSESDASIRETCPKIMELDLSRNLLEDWRDVLAICEQLELLTSIKINGNRLKDLSLTIPEHDEFTISLRRIKTFAVDETLLDWQGIVSLSSVFSSLSSLSASGNSFKHIDSGLLPSSLTELILEDNGFEALFDLRPVTFLPNLRRLVLKFNSISSVEGSDFQDIKRSIRFSSSLEDVDLSYNNINSWIFINGLESAFPGLKSLRVSHNPLYQDLKAPDGKPLSADTGYLLTIARLGQIQTLNYGKVSAKDRLNAETYYLSLIHSSLTLSDPSSHPSILATHPRYTSLCEEYGGPLQPSSSQNGSGVAINPNSLASRLLTVHVRLSDAVLLRLDGVSNPDVAEIQESKEFSIKIPKSFTIYSTLGMIGKKLGLAPLSLRLLWETGEWDAVPQENDTEAGEDWDSEAEEDEDRDASNKVQHVVEFVAGTRLIGTWVDGNKVTLRVEIK